VKKREARAPTFGNDINENNTSWLFIIACELLASIFRRRNAALEVNPQGD